MGEPTFRGRDLEGACEELRRLFGDLRRRHHFPLRQAKLWDDINTASREFEEWYCGVTSVEASVPRAEGNYAEASVPRAEGNYSMNDIGDQGLKTFIISLVGEATIAIENIFASCQPWARFRPKGKSRSGDHNSLQASCKDILDHVRNLRELSSLIRDDFNLNEKPATKPGRLPGHDKPISRWDRVRRATSLMLGWDKSVSSQQSKDAREQQQYPLKLSNTQHWSDVRVFSEEPESSEVPKPSEAQGSGETPNPSNRPKSIETQQSSSRPHRRDFQQELSMRQQGGDQAEPKFREQAAAQSPTGVATTSYVASSTNEFSASRETFEATANFLRRQFSTKLLQQKDPNTSYYPRSTAIDVFTQFPDKVRILYVTAVENPGERSLRSPGTAQFYQAVTGEPVADSNVNLERNVQKTLAVVLAILLQFGVSYQDAIWKTFEDMCDPEKMQFHDAMLPKDPQFLKDAFKDDANADRFYSCQWPFCPIVLQKNDLAFNEHDRNARMPYVGQEAKCGTKGSSGNVFKVVIAKGHVESTKSVNKANLEVARKDFYTDARAQQTVFWEQLIRKRFMGSSVTRHTHITKPIAGLHIGGTLSMFYPCAKYDLAEYMRKRFNGSGPPSLDYKLQILQQFTHLASALDYLHHGIQTSDEDAVSLVHLDLKPENILVFCDSSVGEIFKITDFGISRVHFAEGLRKKKLQELNTSGATAADVASAEAARSLPDIKTLSELAEGSTYISPEAVDRHAQVNSSSDVWAFGCLLCTLASWFRSGWKDGVEEFQRDRLEHHKLPGHLGAFDHFFCRKEATEVTHDSIHDTCHSEGANNERDWICRKVKYELNPAVVLFFKTRIIGGQLYLGPEKALLSGIWTLLEERLLKVDPEVRQKTRMDTVRVELVKLNSNVKNRMKEMDARRKDWLPQLFR